MKQDHFEIDGTEGNYTVRHVSKNGKIFSSNSGFNTKPIAYKHICQDQKSRLKMGGLTVKKTKKLKDGNISMRYTIDGLFDVSGGMKTTMWQTITLKVTDKSKLGVNVIEDKTK